jgi:hypothetical protein
MGYVRSPALGIFLVDDILAVGAAVKGISAIASSAGAIFDSGKSSDEQRQARAAFFRDSGIAGSVTAARYVLGGLQNTASHEIPYYQAAWSAIAAARPDVAAEAEAQGLKWASSVPDPGGTQQMVNDVKQDLAALGQPAPSTPAPSMPTSTTTPTTTRPVQYLPAVKTTAPFNWTPLIWGIGGTVAAIALAKTLGRR